MARLKRLTSREVLRLLGRFGFEVASMRGSHAKLVCIGPSGRKEILLVPVHRQLAVGTIHALYRQACRFIPERELRPGFFAEGPSETGALPL